MTPRLVLDENLPPRLAKALDALGEDVVHLRDIAPEGTPDKEWIELLGREGWVFLSSDRRIRRREIERAALGAHRVGAFFIKSHKLRYCQMVQLVIRRWPELKRAAKSRSPPYALLVPQKGSIRDL